MTSRTLVTIATVAALGFAGIAQAQPTEQHQWRGETRAQHEQQWHGQAQGQAQVQAQPQRQWQQQRQAQAPAYVQRYQAQPYATAPRYVQRTDNYYGQRSYDQRYYAAPQYRGGYAPRYYAGGYGGHGPRYYAGGYYGGRRYWINNWGSYGLYAPPYGYGWVQTDTGDMLLIALATGLIANAILAQ